MAILIGLKEGNDSAVEVYTQRTETVPTDATTYLIAHGLNDINAKLTSCYPFHASGWFTTVTVVARGVNDLTVAFSVPAPSGNTLDWRVDRSV